MIDWEELVGAQEPEDLRKIKYFLFQENLRLEAEKRNLAEERERLKRLQDDFMRDRVKLRDELDELNRRTLQERQRLRQETQFFDKKMEILQDGFRALEEDRRQLERERKAFEQARLIGAPDIILENGDYDEIAGILFANVTSPMGLRKRYRDLVKIFHPDNLFGDELLSQAINREYQRRKGAEEE